MFLLQVFELVFQQTITIYSVIQNRSVDIAYCKSQIEQLLTTIERYRSENHYFIQIYNNTSSIVGSPPKKRKVNLDSAEGTDESMPYKRIYFKILDLIITQIKVRFSNMQNLNFFNLLDTNKCEVYEKKFPTDLFNNLNEMYPSFFNKDKLENELKVFYSDIGILGDSFELLIGLSL